MRILSNKKNIILIRSTEFYSDSRASKTAGSLTKLGYNVIVLAWDRLCKHSQEEAANLKSGDVKILFFRKYCPNGSGKKSIFALLSFNRWIKKQLKALKNDTFAIHACDFDTGYCSYKFAKKNKIKFVYDIYDYYIDSHLIPKILQNFVEKREIKIINNSDAVIICNEARKKQISKSNPKKLYIIHNTPDLQLFDAKKSESNQFRIAYFGILMNGRLVKEIVDFVSGSNEFSLDIGGIGYLEEYIKVKASECSNINFYGKLAYKDVLKYQQQCDVLFATYNPENTNNKFSAPNKLYEAMGLSLPIIVCNGTGIDNIVKENNIGCSIDYNIESLINALKYLQQNPEICKEMGQRARELYETKYNWSVMEQRLSILYNEFEEK